MTTQKRIPVTLVTGFLGSGKTTLINRLLNGAHGLKIAVIENEIAEISIDDELLNGANQTIFRMSNGCLCCTSNGDLVATLLELHRLNSEFDYVIIETTGVANPATVVQTFMLNEDIAELFNLDAVVTVVDSKHIEQHLESRECAAQIALADIVLLNKLDLVDEATAAAIQEKIQAANSIAQIIKTHRSNVSFSQIFNINARSKDIAISESSNDHCEHDHCEHDHELHHEHHDETVVSIGYEFLGQLNNAKFDDWFSNLIMTNGDKLYRCKGIVKIAGQANRVIIQSVHRVTEISYGSAWCDDNEKSKLVFIGMELDRETLISGLKNCLHNT